MFILAPMPDPVDITDHPIADVQHAVVAQLDAHLTEPVGSPPVILAALVGHELRLACWPEAHWPDENDYLDHIETLGADAVALVISDPDLEQFVMLSADFEGRCGLSLGRRVGDESSWYCPPEISPDCDALLVPFQEALGVPAEHLRSAA